MNKFKPLFDIPLAQYDNLNEYPPADDIKRALEAHLVNHPNVPKKPTASINNTAVTANNTNGRKRKRDENGNKSNKSTGQSSSNQTFPICSICGNRHPGKCWIKSLDDVPQHMRERAKRNKERQDNKDKDNKGKTGQ
jgi:hypothetical protein